uniref:Uncharacterized protein n=1 Tax=Fundulus heteroclitus TaxID=8078 RepID=A0A3Q2SNA4_FUNHE
MQQVRVFLLCLLILHQSLARPEISQCVGEICTASLQGYPDPTVNLPSDINVRSIAPWAYQQTTDFNREPMVITQAICQDSHSSGTCNSVLGLETIPVTVRIPVLRKNLRSVKFENITVACICALARIQE